MGTQQQWLQRWQRQCRGEGGGVEWGRGNLGMSCSLFWALGELGSSFSVLLFSLYYSLPLALAPCFLRSASFWNSSSLAAWLPNTQSKGA